MQRCDDVEAMKDKLMIKQLIKTLRIPMITSRSEDPDLTHVTESLEEHVGCVMDAVNLDIR